MHAYHLTKDSFYLCRLLLVSFPITYLAKLCTSSISLFKEAKLIKSIYKELDNNISYGAIGLYSYIQRITFGMKLFMTLNRKFALNYLDKSDIIPLTKEAKDFLSDY